MNKYRQFVRLLKLEDENGLRLSDFESEQVHIYHDELYPLETIVVRPRALQKKDYFNKYGITRGCKL